MKTFTYFCLLITLVALLLPTQRIYSQTEYDYQENLRLERKDKKIKIIKRIYETNDYSDETMYYYDEEGYLVKRCYNNNGTITCPVIVLEHHKNGDITVQNDLGEEGIWTTTGSQSLFDETSFDPYNLVDKVDLIFDENSRLIQKKDTGEDYISIDVEKYFYENEDNKSNRSEYYSDNELLTKKNYYYNDEGLLIKEVHLNMYTNESSTLSYSYEFYN